MKVSVRELKDHLSEYLRRVEAGEEVVVTSHKREVARLVPPAAETAISGRVLDRESAAIERINALPWVRPSEGGKPRGAAKPIPWKPGDKLLSDIVLEDRE